MGSWFKSMCKHMGIRHAKTVAYHSRSNGRPEVAGRRMFETFGQLHIEEPGSIGFSLLGGFYKPSMTYRGLRDCLRTTFYSYGIECLELSGG